MRRFFVLAALLSSLPARAVTIDWVSIGNPGNPADTPPSNCFGPDCGSVSYAYRISRYETTNAQYAEFLNPVDPAGYNTLALYSASMDSDAIFGGIRLVSGNPAGSKYEVKSGFSDKPVTYVSFYDALRFANWLRNGQAGGDTETGAYTLLGGTATPSNGLTVARNAGGTVFVTSEDEWYKAAYYSPGGVYFDYPTGTDAQTTCVSPASDNGNSANCSGAGSEPSSVGAYALSPSPYGTYDQGGNVHEWNEWIVCCASDRGFRGGSWTHGAADLSASNPYDVAPAYESNIVGFRVAPEADAGLLGGAGTLSVLALAAGARRRLHWRRRSRAAAAVETSSPLPFGGMRRDAG